MFTAKTKKSIPKIPTKARLLNIALYYLQRFETSTDNLRKVLIRRIDKYAFFDKEYDKSDALTWVEEILVEFNDKNYINDDRYSNIKVNSLINQGKSKKYIESKLMQKGINSSLIQQTLSNIEYDELEVATKFATKKKIGKFRIDEEKRKLFLQKDFATLIRAGFSYDIAKQLVEDE